jgi:hypothetical protein
MIGALGSYDPTSIMGDIASLLFTFALFCNCKMKSRRMHDNYRTPFEPPAC